MFLSDILSTAFHQLRSMAQPFLSVSGAWHEVNEPVGRITQAWVWVEHQALLMTPSHETIHVSLF